jgi:hypothetical protein
MAEFKTNLSHREGIFLLAIAVVSALACATSLYIGYQRNAVVVSTQQEDDEPRAPLPSGPRKYQ